MTEHRSTRPHAWTIALLTTLACGSDDGDAADTGGSESSTTASTTVSASTTTPMTTAPASDSGDDSSSGTIDPDSGSSGSLGASTSESSTGEPSTGSIGCTSGRGLPEGETMFELDGNQRRYIVHLPVGYTPDQPWPLLFALHPNGGDIEYWNGTEGNQAIRPVVENDAILVLAEDMTNNWPDDLPTELAYIDYILEQAKTELCVDEARVFSMGFSGGGSFSGVLGCMRTEFRAIASGGAIIYFDPEQCVNAPAAWVTIGSGELVPERAAFRDFWRDTGGCMETTMPVDPDPCVAYDGCAAATPVQYCEHDGDHVWPSFGTTAAWAFLSQF